MRSRRERRLDEIAEALPYGSQATKAWRPLGSLLDAPGEHEFVVEQGISGFGSAPVILNWETPSEGLKTLKVYVDFKQQTDESNSKRADNTLTLPLTISEKSASSSNSENNGDALLFSPNFSLTFGVLSFISIIYRRKR